MPALRFVGSKGSAWLARQGGWKGLGKAAGLGILKGGLKLMGKGLGALGGALPGAAYAVAGAAGAALNGALNGGILAMLAQTFEAGASGQSYGMGSSLTAHQKKFALTA
jgi:hypothetical protein